MTDIIMFDTVPEVRGTLCKQIHATVEPSIARSIYRDFRRAGVYRAAARQATIGQLAIMLSVQVRVVSMGARRGR